MTDQLVEIGADLGSCWRRISQIQDECFDLSEDGSREECRKLYRLKKDEEFLAERTFALEAMTTQLRATSLTAAIVQLVMAHRYLRELTESDLDQAEREAACRSIERLMYSMAECLETEAGEQRETIFGTAYMPRSQDPFGSLPDAAAADGSRPKAPRETPTRAAAEPGAIAGEGSEDAMP